MLSNLNFSRFCKFANLSGKEFKPHSYKPSSLRFLSVLITFGNSWNLLPHKSNLSRFCKFANSSGKEFKPQNIKLSVLRFLSPQSAFGNSWNLFGKLDKNFNNPKSNLSRLCKFANSSGKDFKSQELKSSSLRFLSPQSAFGNSWNSLFFNFNFSRLCKFANSSGKEFKPHSDK